ncbi:hypothetical protein PUNSTDRAFT_99186 [Punctularia strigosozonata HHB-11173 SS5]|uniref:uncharacterized protein n=1 Tax=Punctularia strigosozonata (strain HHB-11173) TaxID=741275 RepID=UPI0004417557|nr:uncharacterized protein PUNSTDRAFT_99186 [Punctularia strigosozonata HHB-11173 SS5]EIN11888.1 hypothetical protein PUNSTDRAFT_99186 [Punctularia strigosozonata HHB-11173 SS5]
MSAHPEITRPRSRDDGPQGDPYPAAPPPALTATPSNDQPRPGPAPTPGPRLKPRGAPAVGSRATAPNVFYGLQAAGYVPADPNDPARSLAVASPDAAAVAAAAIAFANASANGASPAWDGTQPPPDGAEVPGSPSAIGTHYINTSAVPRLPPILQVEKQQVTTSATQAASASRRRNEANFVCPVPGCGSTFTRRFNLRGHLRSHTEERPYVCEWPGCGKGFARQHDCKRHQALHYQRTTQNVCHGCGKTFSRLDALNRHLRSEGGADCRAQHAAMQSQQNMPPAPATVEAASPAPPSGRALRKTTPSAPSDPTASAYGRFAVAGGTGAPGPNGEGQEQWEQRSNTAADQETANGLLPPISSSRGTS